MRDFKIGDKARVTAEGEVVFADVESKTLQIKLPGAGLIFTEREGVTFRLLERAKPKVGDILTGYEFRAVDLPVGSTALVDVNGGQHWHRQRSDWVCSDGRRGLDRIVGHRIFRIVYIPESAE